MSIAAETAAEIAILCAVACVVFTALNVWLGKAIHGYAKQIVCHLTADRDESAPEEPRS